MGPPRISNFAKEKSKFNSRNLTYYNYKERVDPNRRGETEVERGQSGSGRMSMNSRTREGSTLGRSSVK